MPVSVRILFAVVLSAVVVGPAWAQSGTSVRVAAEANPMTATVGERITVTVRVEGAPATVVRTPSRPAAPQLEPLGDGPQTRRFRATVDGTVRRGVAFSWTFRSRQQGTVRIAPVLVVIRGERYTTDEIRVRVRRPSQPSRLTFPEGMSEGTALDEGDLFIRATSTARRAYQNEQVVVEYRLFYRPDIRLRHSRLADSWDAPGFWREELTVASRPTPDSRRVGGRRYETVVLKRVALFPTRPGTLRIDPLCIETEAQGTMRMEGRGAALRGRFEPVRLASQRLSVDVQALPTPAPPSFDGAVGQFSVRAQLGADSAVVGKAIPLTVRVEGTGNLTTLSPPALDVPGAVEVYDPSIDTDLERTGRRIQGTRTFTYSVVPRTGGRHDLPPVQLTYFNPETRRYQTRRASLPTLQVEGTAAPQAVGRTGNGLPVGDITDVMAADEVHWMRTDHPPLYQRPWAYLGLLLPVLLAGGALLYRQWNTAAAKRRTRRPEPKHDTGTKALQAARSRLDEGESAAVHEEVERAVRTALAERLEQNGQGGTRASLDRHLARHDVPASLRDRTRDLLERCGRAQYAPGASDRAALEALLDDARSVLDQLDAHLSARGH